MITQVLSLSSVLKWYLITLLVLKMTQLAPYNGVWMLFIWSALSQLLGNCPKNIFLLRLAIPQLHPPPSYLLFESSPCYWSIPSNRDLLFSLSFSFFFLPLPLHPCDLYLHPTPQSCNRSPAFLYSPQQLAVSHFNLTSQRRLMGKVYTTSFGVRENLLVGTATRS